MRRENNTNGATGGEIVKRLNTIRKHYNMTEREFCLEIGVYTTALTRIKKGGTLGMSLVNGLAKRFPEVNMNYLIKGHLPVIMENTAKQDVIEKLSSRIASLENRMVQNGLVKA